MLELPPFGTFQSKSPATVIVLSFVPALRLPPLIVKPPVEALLLSSRTPKLTPPLIVVIPEGEYVPPLSRVNVPVAMVTLAGDSSPPFAIDPARPSCL